MWSAYDGKASTARAMAARARSAGAEALLLTSPHDADFWSVFWAKGGEASMGLPVIAVRSSLVARWVDGVAFASAPSTLLRMKGKQVQGRVERASVRNVVAAWPGSGALAEEVVVLGAHYDHLGLGEGGAVLHPGADDNASGVAAAICAVERLVATPPAGDRRTVVLAAFAGEELGLLGSQHYVDHVPLDRTVAMVALDMVGHAERGVEVQGVDTAWEWLDWVREGGVATGLQVRPVEGACGDSDHRPFHVARVPVVHFFTGTTPEYHIPADRMERMDMAQGVKVVGLVEHLVRAVTTSVITFLPTDADACAFGQSRRGSAQPAGIDLKRRDP